MRNIKIYGNNQWQACTMLKEDLSNKNIKFEYIDILESMSNLKQFLYFRDNFDIFEEYKISGKLGIPLSVIEENGERKLFIENYKADFI